MKKNMTMVTWLHSRRRSVLSPETEENAVTKFTCFIDLHNLEKNAFTVNFLMQQIPASHYQLSSMTFKNTSQNKIFVGSLFPLSID